MDGNNRKNTLFQSLKYKKEKLKLKVCQLQFGVATNVLSMRANNAHNTGQLFFVFNCLLKDGILLCQ